MAQFLGPCDSLCEALCAGAKFDTQEGGNRDSHTQTIMIGVFASAPKPGRVKRSGVDASVVDEVRVDDLLLC